MTSSVPVPAASSSRAHARGPPGVLRGPAVPPTARICGMCRGDDATVTVTVKVTGQLVGTGAGSCRVRGPRMASVPCGSFPTLLLGRFPAVPALSQPSSSSVPAQSQPTSSLVTAQSQPGSRSSRRRCSLRASSAGAAPRGVRSQAESSSRTPAQLCRLSTDSRLPLGSCPRLPYTQAFPLLQCQAQCSERHRLQLRMARASKRPASAVPTPTGASPLSWLEAPWFSTGSARMAVPCRPGRKLLRDLPSLCSTAGRGRGRPALRAPAEPLPAGTGGSSRLDGDSSGRNGDVGGPLGAEEGESWVPPPPGAAGQQRQWQAQALRQEERGQAQQDASSRNGRRTPGEAQEPQWATEQPLNSDDQLQKGNPTWGPQATQVALVEGGEERQGPEEQQQKQRQRQAEGAPSAPQGAEVRGGWGQQATHGTPDSRGVPAPGQGVTGVPRGAAPSRDVSERVEELMEEGLALLQEGRQGLLGSLEIGLAETLLAQSAERFEEAYRLDSTCLVALGQSGNALLGLGELKLKAARLLRVELRLSLMQTRQRSARGLQRKGRRRARRQEEEEEEEEDEFFVLRNARARRPGEEEEEEELEELEEEEEERRRVEEMAEAAAVVETLGDECEEALVEAGRRYRAALSLDKSDARALYNWGLALCYRAQLVMDEADEDFEELADRMLRAAIDKFEAMLSLTDNWRPGALHNIGLAVRDRSRLRPLRSPTRLRLLKEARACLRDALRWDSSNAQLKAALTACTAELDMLSQLAEETALQEKGRGTGEGPDGGRRQSRGGGDSEWSS